MHRRRLVALATVVFCAVVVVTLARWGGDDGPAEPFGLAPGRGLPVGLSNPFTWRTERNDELSERAAAGYSHVLYAKSPGGVFATAERVVRYRGDIERVAADVEVDPDMLEALVFLESGGRPDARASNDLEGAAGLTQILAETGTNLLEMRIDVRVSEKLTRGIARGTKVAAREQLRRRVDERFDPRKALEATGRYLTFAKSKLDDREDLAFVSYHMGVGNLRRALDRYGEGEVPYAQLFFDSTPLRHAEAWSVLAALGDDSSTYLWRLLAAKEIMRLWREDRSKLNATAVLQLNKASAEEVLHPPGTTRRYRTPGEIASAAGELVALDPAVLARYGLRIDPKMGELATRVKTTRQTYRALRPEAYALLQVLGAAVKETTGGGFLRVTSTVRDNRYQAILARRNIEATDGYSLHTTGWAFDIARDYSSRKQARAFQFFLDRLQALDLIAWVREPGAIHVTVGPRAGELR